MEKQVIVRNLLISYLETTGESGRTLLFLHGWRSNKEAWSGITRKILDIRYGILAIDLPGFGKSQVPKQAMTVGDYAAVVEGFIRKLELRDVIIVGHSFGGRVGIKLAANHPELVSKLVLVDSAGFAAGESKKNLMRAAAKIMKPFFKPRFMQPLRKRIYRAIGAEDYVATPELRQTFVNTVQEDLSGDMQKIVCPTLIVNGENDADTPVDFGKRMSYLIPNSKFQILNNAGHFSFIDQPEEFAGMLSRFIA
jgi:pimeloyl-ACP methyl ester carboxylesterase